MKREFIPHPKIALRKADFDPEIHEAYYRTDYIALFESIAKGETNALAAYKALILSDLFFIIYFIFGIPDSKQPNHPFIVNRCQDVELGPQDSTLDVWFRGGFKAVDCNELVPTPYGWTKHGDLKVGDKVFTVDGRQSNVIAKTRVFTDANCYRITFSNKYSIIVSGDHLWEVWRKSSKRIKGMNGRRYTREKHIKSTKELSLYGHEPDKRWAVPIAEPVEYAKVVRCYGHGLLIPPYTLGCWLGDGHSSGGRLTCAYKDIELINYIKADGILVKEGKSPNKNSGLFSLDSGIRGQKETGMTSKLRKLNLKNNKHIPAIYLMSAIKDREELLKGLMDTDGTCVRGKATFCNINRRLAEDVFELAASLGKNPYINKYISQVNGEDYPFYQVSFQAYKDNPPFKLKRKIGRCAKERVFNFTTILSVEPVKSIPISCIQIDNPRGVYLIGRNFIPTHNSTIITIAETIQYSLKYPECSTGIFSYKAAVAKQNFLFEIKQEFETRPIYHQCFPNIVWEDPQREAPIWSLDGGLVLERDTNRKEPNVSGHGLIEGMPTGLHFERRVYDDIVTEDIADSPEQIEKVKKKFDSSQNLKTHTEMDCHRVVGTFYHYNDPLTYIRDKKIAGTDTLMYQMRKFPATHDGSPGGRSVFLPEQELNKLRGDRTFNCQQLLDPSPEDIGKLDSAAYKMIDPEDIPKGCFKFIVVDQAGDLATNIKAGDNWAIGEFAVYPFADDTGASDVYIEELVAEPLSETEAVDIICKMYVHAGVVKQIGVEKVGMSSTHNAIRKVLKESYGRTLTIVTDGKKLKYNAIVILRPAGRNKTKFIESSLSWPMSNGKVHISSAVLDKYRALLELETDQFPYGATDDILNIIAYLYDMIFNYDFPKVNKKRKYCHQMVNDGGGDAWMG